MLRSIGIPGIVTARHAAATNAPWVPGIERADAQLRLFEKLRTAAHQSESGLVPSYGLVYGQPPALQMLDHQLEGGKRLFKRPVIDQGADRFQRRWTADNTIHGLTIACGERGSAASMLDFSAPSARRATTLAPASTWLTLNTGFPSSVRCSAAYPR